MHIVANHSEFDIDEHLALLPALREHGVCAQFSCRNGNCGLCEATLNAGRVWLDDKRQLVDAPASILLCRAFARSDLALSVNVAPRAVSRYCRVLRMQQNEGGYEVELQLPVGRMPGLLAGEQVQLEADVSARPLAIVLVTGSSRSFVLRLLEQDGEWLGALASGGVRVVFELPLS